MGYVLLAFWLIPLVEASLMIAGWIRVKLTEHKFLDSGATQAVIQITTIGNYETVNDIIATIRSYELPFPFEFWVVTEAGIPNHYVGADAVYEVPESFVTKAHYKARAQEYSRHVRKQLGLDRHDVKIIMVDDDSLPTRAYFVKAFNADYDICEGIITPRRGYGRFMTHLDDVRTQSCLVSCAFWQGVGHPIWVHGEGLCFRGSAEAAVTWNYPVIASEDMTVGHNAVEAGLTWGFMYEFVQITAPWSFKDFVIQRRRWLWGNIDAVQNGLIPPLGAFLSTGLWFSGLISFIVVTAGLVLVPLGIWQAPQGFQPFLVASLICWLTTFGIGCWISAQEPGISLPRRILNTLAGIVMTPLSTAVSSLVTYYCLAKGPTGGFEVIAKALPR